MLPYPRVVSMANPNGLVWSIKSGTGQATGLGSTTTITNAKPDAYLALEPVTSTNN